MQYIYRIFVESLGGTEVTVCFAKNKLVATQILDLIPTGKMCLEKVYTEVSEAVVDL
ncbi:MAG: hypothetical protein Q4Q24_00510 [Methanobrevibacter ruminantium]|uniref:hypothetical protein n=1 Tax=Methanobrevibacter ruminantium TaxID=83816 RepID=UPI0026EB8319|nr:hypothetical protein [Methanobrevibacter ruminantium]MDO5841736.1 hypothetical protein [Methanobrevibacter ruminantium]